MRSVGAPIGYGLSLTGGHPLTPLVSKAARRQLGFTLGTLGGKVDDPMALESYANI